MVLEVALPYTSRGEIYGNHTVSIKSGLILWHVKYIQIKLSDHSFRPPNVIPLIMKVDKSDC